MHRRAAFLILMLSGTTRAEETEFNRFFDAAKRTFVDVQYEEALNFLKIAREKADTSEQRVQVELLEGILQGHLLKTEKARRAFLLALAIHPDAQLASLGLESGSVNKLFLEVRDEVLKAKRSGADTSNTAATDTQKKPDSTTSDPTAKTFPVEEAPEIVVPVSPGRSWLGPGLLVGAGTAAIAAGVAFGVSRFFGAAAPNAWFSSDARQLAFAANAWGTVSLLGLVVSAGLAAWGLGLVFGS